MLRHGWAAVLAAGLALAGCQPAARETATTATAPATRYDARAFYETTSYMLAYGSGEAFSPDGQHILITSDKSGVFNADSLPTAGGDPTALTTSTANATYAVSYFPADERVLVSADQGGNEIDHLYVREADGTLRDLTPGDKEKADFYGWSADGKTFWVTSNVRDPQAFDVYAYDAGTYQRKLVFQNTDFFPSAISRDGRWLALVKENTSADSDIYLADLSKPATPPVLLTQHSGDVAYGVYDFTPDSKALIFATNEHGEYNQAWSHDLTTGARAAVIEADWDVMFVTFSPSGRYRVSGVNVDASTELTLLDTQSGAEVVLKGVPAGDLGQVRFDRKEERIAFTVASDTSPSDVFVADLATGEAKRLTTALNPAIDETQLVEATVVRYPSFDGLEIPSILYKPKGASAANPAPALVYVHGGPGGQTRRGYSAQIQHLVNHGYAVLGANNRGSSGYGKTFFHMDDRKHGEVDLQDIVRGRAYLETLDWVDKGHIGVMGGSYGGYMVAAALAFEPDAFDVGVNIFGVTNWSRTLASIPAWWGAQRKSLYDEMGDPATDAERHQRISPLFHAANIKKPLLVVQGANDPRVLQVESDELVAAVKANNVPVEYVIFPDEGHGFQRKENRITASDAFVAFLDTYLKAQPATPAQ
jgi:dipeptidyl aminopeptidase/acylaminoacyl peptidase